MDNQFNQIPTQPEAPKNSGVAIAALVCGIVGFFINPVYLVSLAAIILGIVGLAAKDNQPKGMATTGLVLGCVSLVMQFIADLLLSVFTLGLSFCI